MKAEGWSAGAFAAAFKEVMAKFLKINYFSADTDALGGLLNILQSALVIGLGTVRVLDRVITVGTLTAFMSFQGRLIQPILSLFEIMSAWSQIKPNLQRLADLLGSFETPRETQLTNYLCITLSSIAVKGGPGRPDRLGDFSHSFHAGKITAVVGPNGSGKSTLCLALAGLLPPYRGSLALGGVPVTEHAWRSTFPGVFLIPQGAKLFAASIRDNICLGVSGVSEEDMWESLSSVGLRSRITEMPQGLETHLTDRLNTFSGGEKQKLLLVRALLRGPQVLLLDEALSAIPNEDLPGIVALLRRKICMNGGLVILTSHNKRLTSLCDEELRLKGAAEIDELRDVDAETIAVL